MTRKEIVNVEANSEILYVAPFIFFLLPYVNQNFTLWRDSCIIFPFVQQPSLSSSAWGSVSTNPCTNWGSDSSSIWSDAHNSNMGFWDEAVKEAAQPPPQPRKSNAQKNSKGNANLRYLF